MNHAETKWSQLSSTIDDYSSAYQRVSMSNELNVNNVGQQFVMSITIETIVFIKQFCLMYVTLFRKQSSKNDRIEMTSDSEKSTW